MLDAWANLPEDPSLGAGNLTQIAGVPGLGAGKLTQIINFSCGLRVVFSRLALFLGWTRIKSSKNRRKGLDFRLFCVYFSRRRPKVTATLRHFYT